MALHMTLKKKFLGPTIILIVLGMGITSTVSYLLCKNALSKALIQEITQVNDMLGKALNNWLKSCMQESQELMSESEMSLAFEEGNYGMETIAVLNKRFKAFKDTYGHYEDVCLADSTGGVVAASTPGVIGKVTVGDREYFKTAMQGSPTVSDIVQSKVTGEPIVALAYPVKKDGKTLGVFYSLARLTTFNQTFVDSIRVGEHGYAYIINRAGQLAAHPDKRLLMKKILEDLGIANELETRDQGVITYTFQGVEKLVVFLKLKRTKWIVAAGGFTDEIFAPIHQLRNVCILLTLVIAALAAGIVYIITHSVVNPINHVKDNLKDAAEGEGDLTKRLPVTSNDEVGELARWFNVFIEKIQSTIGDVAQNARDLANSSTTLTGISNELSEGAEHIASQADSVSAAGEEMSISMNSVAQTMDHTTANVNQIAAAIEQMESTINDIARNTDQARSTTHEAVGQAQTVTEQMAVLSRAAQEIEKVIETITDISEQVNLLALNATIEAARAGEAGKGFAVVANEIKELARQTSMATGEIKDRVTAIQQSTTTSTEQMETIARVVTDVNDIVSTIAAAIEEQSSSTRDMSGNLSEASNGMNEVNTNVAQSSQLSNDISGQISDVTQAIKTMADRSNQVNTQANTLSGMADTLNTLVGRFKA